MLEHPPKPTSTRRFYRLCDNLEDMGTISRKDFKWETLEESSETSRLVLTHSYEYQFIQHKEHMEQIMAMKLEAQWIVGFTDGEGCFHIGVNTNSKLCFGKQILPEFVVVQHQRDLPLLYAMKEYFGCGIIRASRQHPIGKIYAYRVRNIKHLDEIILPFFEKYSLKTQKRLDFIFFRGVVRSLMKKDHLEFDTFQLLIEKIEKWRHQRKEGKKQDANKATI